MLDSNPDLNKTWVGRGGVVQLTYQPSVYIQRHKQNAAALHQIDLPHFDSVLSSNLQKNQKENHNFNN